MKYTLFLLLFGLLVSCQDQTTENQTIQEKLDALFQNLSESGDFNGSVLVATSEDILYKDAFGYVDGSQNTPLNTDNKFAIGSIYKELPGLAIMLLKEQGKLSLEDKISTYLPNLPKWSTQITIRHLLQYTSGLPKVNWGTFEVVNDEALLTALNDLDQLEFEPGEDYLYTNYSPFLLSKIVESISNQAFEEFVQENILSPHDLTQSIFKNAFPYQDRTDVAIPFDENFQEDEMPFTIASPIFLFVTTVEDLYKFLEALHNFKIISKTSLIELARKTTVKANNIQSPLGTVIIKNDEIIKHRHHGSSGNYEALITRFQEEKITIVLTTNQKRRNLSEITENIYELVKQQ
ncbi:MAG: serine hydrolase domain-containing protein [Bacteroidota bacterium]